MSGHFGAGRWMGEGLVDGPSDKAPARFPRRPHAPFPLIVAVCAWVVLAAWQSWAIDGADRSVPDTLASGVYEIEVVEDAKLGSYGYSAHVALRDASGARREVLATYGPSDVDGDPRLLARQKITARVSFSEFSDASFARYASKGLCAKAKLSNAVVGQVGGPMGMVVQARCAARDALDGFDGKGAALVSAVAIGDRARLDDDGLYDDVKTVGLAHMVAVSGAHLSVVAAFVSALLTRARVSRLLLSVVLCVFYAAYAAFTGFSAPVIRAALMAGIVVNAAWGARRASSLSALGVCVCLLLAWRPCNALSLSLFLSAASTLGIVVLAPLAQAWFSTLLGGRAKALCEACALTTAANIPMFAVTACVFSRVALLAPISNLVAAPAFTVLIGGALLSLGASTFLPAVGHAMLSAVVFFADGLCALFGLMARVPFASVPCSLDEAFAAGLSAAVFAGLWAVWPRPTWGRAAGAAVAAVAAALACIVVLPLFDPDEIVALDVGQGDAILVKSQGASLLVDTGNQDALLAAALARAHVPHLDGVAITHHDDDHCASLDSLTSNISGANVYVAAGTATCGCSGCDELLRQARSASGRDAVALAVGDEVRVGRFTCRVVWPAAFRDEGGNADSLCLLVSRESAAGSWTALLVGDAEADQIAEIVKGDGRGHAGTGAVDVFKAGHHGSKAGMDETLASALSPEIALVSCGANNRYGHPAPSTVEALEAAGAQVFRTDELGDIACVFSQEGISVVTQRACEVDIE